MTGKKALRALGLAHHHYTSCSASRTARAPLAPLPLSTHPNANPWPRTPTPSTNQIASAKVDNLDCWRVRLELPREDLLGKLPHSLRVSSKKSRHEGPPASAATTASAAAASTSSAVPAAAEGSASGPAPGPAATARTSTAGAGASAAESSVVAQGLFWNYLSVGLDAKAAHGFHSLREERPGCASGRLMNQFWYSFFSCTSGGWLMGADVCTGAPDVPAGDCTLRGGWG